MKLKLKNYKYYKIKNYFKNQKMFFIYNNSDLNFKNWLQLQQNFQNKSLKCYKLNNNLTINFLNNSIFKNVSSLVNGSIIIIGLKKNIHTDLLISQLQTFNTITTFLSLKLNNKIYSNNQVSTIKTLNYHKQIVIFTKSLKRFFKQPYNKLKNRNNVI